MPTATEPAARFPAILEMIPYGKDNWRRNADVARGTYLAQRGYVLCRLDVRGTGSSGGIALDEYTEAETLDGYDAVEWLAAQPWCTGAVGMWGISYGGFTSIQVAKLRPPHLRAIVPVQATDDRYLTDVHYIGGCVTASELSQYAVSQVAMNAMPPGSGDRRARAGEPPGPARLEATPPWLFEWLRQQHDGPYWRPGSLAPDYDAIDAAILNVGGWMDSYVDAALADAGRLPGAVADDRRQLGPRPAVVGDARAEPRRAPRDRPLLRSLAQGDPQRRRRGAGGRLVRAGVRRARAVPRLALPGAGARRPPIRTRPSSRGRGRSPAVRCRSSGGWSTAPDDASGADRYRHRPTIGTRASLSWGAGGPPNGLARDLRPDESLGPTYTSAPLANPLRDPRRARGRCSTWRSRPRSRRRWSA